jgi:hypothetical protein
VVDTVDPVAVCKDITIYLDVTGNASISENAVDNGSTDACGIASYDTDVTTFSCSDVGGNSVVLTVTDENGNTDQCSATVTVADSIDPTISCVGSASRSMNSDACTYTASNGEFDPTDYDDNCSGASVAYTLSGATTGSGSSLNGVAFNKGTTNVTWTVTDASGNTATCSFTVTVTDNQNPTITCPANITLSACQTTATWGTPVHSDNCPGTTLSSTYTSPLSVANGQTITVTYTATDASGNTASCSFSVTRQSALTVEAGPNDWTNFGFALDEYSTRTATASGGVAPYTYSWSLDRPLICNQVNDDGDESLTGGSCSNTTCPAYPANTLSLAPTCSGNATITARLIDTAKVTVTVTDANGCTATDFFMIYSEDARCWSGNGGQQKIAICHMTGSQSNPCQKICVNTNAVASHLAHGDFVGNCTASCSPEENNKTGDSTSHAHAYHEVNIYPNPTNGLLNVGIEVGADEDFEVHITNLLGQSVVAKSAHIPEGYHVEVFDLTDLAVGMYLVQVRIGDELQTWQVMVSH